jgi:hypothetical protein
MVTPASVVPRTVAASAGHILARAALDAFSSVSRMSGAEKRGAYSRFNMEEDLLPENDDYRIELICQTLEKLLVEPVPEIPWDELQSAIAERIQAARKQLDSPRGISPTSLLPTITAPVP